MVCDATWWMWTWTAVTGTQREVSGSNLPYSDYIRKITPKSGFVKPTKKRTFSSVFVVANIYDILSLTSKWCQTETSIWCIFKFGQKNCKISKKIKICRSGSLSNHNFNSNCVIMLLRKNLKRRYRRDSSDSDSDGSDDEIIRPAVNLNFNRIKLLVVLKSVLSLEGHSMLPMHRFRGGNQQRDRIGIIRWAAELDEKMFRRQFRLVREDFFYSRWFLSAL